MHSGNDPYSINKYYRDLNPGFDHADQTFPNIIKQITGFSSEKIELNQNGYNKLLKDLNFSFYELDSSNDYFSGISDVENYKSTKQKYYNFRLSILLLHYYNNKTNNFFNNNKNDNSYNIVDFKYKFGVDPDKNNEMLDLSNSYPVSNNLNNINLLTKWRNIYTDPHQYLTIAD